MVKRAVIVTGAGHGIGRAIVVTLAAEGFGVVIADKDERAAEDVRRAVGSDSVVCAGDVSREDDVKRMIAAAKDAFGGLDAIVNNAAISDPVNIKITDMPLEEWNERLAVNLTSVFLFAKHGAALLRARSGSIVNMSSTRALMSEPNTEAYAAAKGGVEALTHALAISLGPKVRVNAIRPGWIDTKGEPLPKKAHAQHPVGRVGTPNDIAGLVAYLVGPRAGFVTGQVFTVDGGMTRKMMYE